MSNDYRSITGLFKKYWTNEPLANATIIIRLLTNSFTLEAGYPSTKTPGNANDPGRSFQTDEDGNLPEGLALFCSASSIGGGTTYRVTEPDGFEWTFILDYGDGTPISMQTLRAGGLPASNPTTVIALIENKISDSAVRFDIAQTLTTEQQNRVKTALGIMGGSGGGVAIGDEIDGATSGRGLFVDGDGKLADSANFSITSSGYLTANRFAFSTIDYIHAPGGFPTFRVIGQDIWRTDSNAHIKGRSDFQVVWAANLSALPDVGIRRVSEGRLGITAGWNSIAYENSEGELEVGTLYLSDGTSKQVGFGMNDSAGDGYKVLKIAN